jgi:two-component system response regulator TctD
MRILLVEDEVELATWLTRALEQSNFSIEWSNNGLMAERILAAEEFDAVILDLGLPGKDGHGVLAYLRATDNRVPVLILTARDSLSEKVSSLHEGADDFLPKPFVLMELEARLVALIRRSRGREHPRLSCGALTLEVGTRQFYMDGVPLALTPREYSMLHALIQRSGEPVSKQFLLDRVFAPGDDVGADAVDVLIYRLRKKIANGMIRITTLRGFGYCLENKVERLERT